MRSKLILLASGASVSEAVTSERRARWSEAWKSCARQITSSGLCRAACHLMTAILGRGLCQYAEVADIANNMVSSIDLNGPLQAVDSSINMWITMTSLRAGDNLKSAYETVERILHWLFVRWSPSKCKLLLSTAFLTILNRIFV